MGQQRETENQGQARTLLAHCGPRKKVNVAATAADDRERQRMRDARCATGHPK